MIDQILEILSDGQVHTIDDLIAKLPPQTLRKSVILTLRFLEEYTFVVIQHRKQLDNSLVPEKVVLCSEVRNFLFRIKQLEAQYGQAQDSLKQKTP